MAKPKKFCDSLRLNIVWVWLGDFILCLYKLNLGWHIVVYFIVVFDTISVQIVMNITMVEGKGKTERESMGNLSKKVN